METTYSIKWAHGQMDSFDTYEEAVAAVHSVLGVKAEIGHSGDINDGGETSLFWADAEDAENDDGVRAKGKIQKAYRDE